MERKNYILMWRDIPVTAVVYDDSGRMIHFSKDYDKEYMPPEEMRDPERSLKKWWENRAVPVSQGKIRHMLEERGNILPEAYLKENLGLSLSDYYWVKPIDSSLKWKDVSLFSNPFVDDLDIMSRDYIEGTPRYTPNSSLQGQLEKTWTIINGERNLIKGNHGKTSAESINEVIASEIHRLQGTHAYADYSLIHIKDKDYDYGCMTKSFTSESKEFVSAYALFSSEKKPSDISDYQHLLNVCKNHGMDVDTIREGLEYQIMTDYIISGYDRHLNNIGFIRRADTMKYEGLSPIYDSGGSLFAGQRLPASVKDLQNIETNGIGKNEQQKLKLVTNPNVIDVSRLPPVSYIREMYEKDSQAEKHDIDIICWAYEKKIDMCRNLQLGKTVVTTMPVTAQLPQNMIDEVKRYCEIILCDKIPDDQNSSFDDVMNQAKTKTMEVKAAKESLAKLICESEEAGLDIAKLKSYLTTGQTSIINTIINDSEKKHLEQTK